MKRNIPPNIDAFLGAPDTLHGKFHEATKIKVLAEAKPVARSFKDYPRLEKILLPEPQELSQISLQQVLMTRKSIREFSNKPISMETLGTFFYYCGGIRGSNLQKSSKRFYPSAGGIYPLEIYFVSLKSDLEKAVYHYNVRDGLLEKIAPLGHFSYKKYFNQKWIKDSAGILIITAVFFRNTQKYGDRGYRVILQESGYMGQLIYLISTALNIGCCAINGFLDAKLDELLDVDGVNESVVSVFAVGSL